jgi:hypothetical protein
MAAKSICQALSPFLWLGRSTSSSEKVRDELANLNSRCTVTVFGGTGLLCRRIVRHLADFPFGSRQGIRIGGTDYLVLMIRNFNPRGPTRRYSDLRFS